ncbi:MAG: phytanoyl-CoA dioxygenase family protein [Alphaproteobacteria bacterium]
MDIESALDALGVRPTDLRPEERAALDKDGFFARQGVLTPAECDGMGAAFDRLSAAEGARGGHEVHIEPTASRVSDIFNKTDAFDRCLAIAPVLAAARHLLGPFKVHGANLRDPHKGGGHQDIHVDVPKNRPDDWWVLNAIFAFDDITLENGPPRAVPGSHRWAPINVPYVNVGDWTPQPLSPEDAARVPADLAAPYPGEVFFTAPRGSVLVLNSCTWHGGTRNVGGARRRVLHLTYTRRDLPQQLVQRAHLTPGLYDRMSQAMRWLLDIDDEGTVDPAMLRSAARASKRGDWWA